MNQKSQLNEQVDMLVAYKFIKILTTDFEDTDAFKMGIIDKDGNILKKRKDLKGDERTAYTIFHTLLEPQETNDEGAWCTEQIRFICHCFVLIEGAT